MNQFHLLLGSNEGNRPEKLANALSLLKKNAGKIILSSQIYETASWGNEELPSHLNQAVLLESSCKPEELLMIIHEIEYKLGRERQVKWGLRTIDIDIIYFQEKIIQTETLTIPHPLLQDRRFVLVPLQDIAAQFLHPILLRTNEELLELCPDSLEVNLY